MAGVVFTESASLKQLIVSKADSLFKPYFVVLIGLGIGKIFTRSATLFQYFLGIIYATNAPISWEPLWFLPHLFVALLSVWSILMVTQNCERRSLWISCVVAVLLAIGGIFIDVFWRIDLANYPNAKLWLDRPTHLPGLPFSLDPICLSSAYILLGRSSPSQSF